MADACEPEIADALTRSAAAGRRSQPEPAEQKRRTDKVSDTTDANLIARIREGDQSALPLFFERHSVLLRSITFRVINNHADVDDIMQELWVEIWHQAARYRPENGNVLGWIITVARRRAIDWVRKRQAHERAKDRFRVEQGHVSRPQSMRDAERRLAASEYGDVFGRLMDGLPPEQRRAVDLAFYRNLSQRQVAAHTGLPLGTVKTRIELGLRKLRKQLLREGGAAEWSNQAR